MSHIPYPFEQIQPTQYKFFSIGRNKIEKIVDFVPYKTKNVMNLGFGDLLPDGSIDDRIVSNNGDIKKVLATIVVIVKHFTSLHPQVIIHFSGSTDERTKLYTRILVMYHASFKKEFEIYGIIGTENKLLTLYHVTHQKKNSEKAFEETKHGNGDYHQREYKGRRYAFP